MRFKGIEIPPRAAEGAEGGQYIDKRKKGSEARDMYFIEVCVGVCMSIRIYL